MTKSFVLQQKKVKVGRIKNETFELPKLKSGVSTRPLLAIKKVIQKDVNVESTSSLKSHMKVVNDLYSDLFCIEEVKIDNEIVPIVYVLIGLKVGSEISGIIDNFLTEEETV